MDSSCLFFFFNDTATTEIYTLSLHDALPIYENTFLLGVAFGLGIIRIPSPKDIFFIKMCVLMKKISLGDRKSTRLNSSHQIISYAVFCLKKKNLEPLLRFCTYKPHSKRTFSL